MAKDKKKSAQDRVDQIESFQKEIGDLVDAGILDLNEDQKKSIFKYQDTLKQGYQKEYGIDSNNKQRQLSFAMKIVSFFAAVCFSVGIVFLYYRFWGSFSTTAQLVIISLTPVFFLCLSMYSAAKEKTRYFSKLLGMISFSAFYLNIEMFGEIFNLPASNEAILLPTIFAFLLAYACDTILLLIPAIILAHAYIFFKIVALFGFYTFSVFNNLESFFITSFIIFFISFLPHKNYIGFSMTYRIYSMVIFFTSIFILSTEGNLSYLHFSLFVKELIYCFVGLIFASVITFIGVKKSLTDMVNFGVLFFILILYGKLYDWFSSLIPLYLFFFIIALISLGAFFVFKALRKKTIENKKRV